MLKPIIIGSTTDQERFNHDFDIGLTGKLQVFSTEKTAF
jgi:hypothetical protein